MTDMSLDDALRLIRNVTPAAVPWTDAEVAGNAVPGLADAAIATTLNAVVAAELVRAAPSQRAQFAGGSGAAVRRAG